MEDRTSLYIYVETSPLEVDSYLQRRNQQLVGQFTDATYWENTCPSRNDIPSTMAEFRTLAVYETASHVSAAPPANESCGYFFERCPRPAQGHLLQGESLGLGVVFVNPSRPQSEQDLRDWADLVHIRIIASAALDHFGMITPYVNVGVGPRFCHLYEFDTVDPDPEFMGMTPKIQEHLSERSDVSYDEWLSSPVLDTLYVNTFRRHLQSAVTNGDR
jgi:hypothetical protein